MNRKLYASILVAAVCLSFGLLTGCSSSSSTPPPPPTIAIKAVTADATQSTTVSTAFANPLGVTVTSNGSPLNGATVTYTANSSTGGATCTLSATTGTTDANGNVNSVTCTANSTAGSYTVTATTTNATTPATFNLTNNPPAVTTSTFVFSVSGTELPNAFNNGTLPDYYAIVGAVQFDSTGKFLGGEQDYNDGDGITSPAATGDTFAASSPGFSSSVLSTGQGTLTLVSENACACEGQAGTETFAVQFISPTHALITQFDGTATSSGTMDLQTATKTGGSGNFAFTFSGVDDITYSPVGYGGVFNVATGGGITGTADVNDLGLNAGNGGLVLGAAFNGTSSHPDSYGRGTTSGITINGYALALNYYVVGPEVMRLIDVDTGANVDTGEAMAGSAYGQGSTGGVANSFTNASLGASVVTLANNSMGNLYATLGQFTTSNTTSNPASLAGVVDDTEPDMAVNPLLIANPLAGTYSLTTSGYGSASITGAGDITTLGVYMTDPTLNLTDPNATTDLGGALVLDQDLAFAGGVGVIVSQTGTKAADFTGSYAAGFQEFNNFNGNCPSGCEWDMVSSGSNTAGALALTGMDSDPFGSLNATSTPGLSSGDTFGSTPQADTTNVGRWSMLSSNTTPNPLAVVVNTTEKGNLNMDIYQASGTLLFWIELDAAGVASGYLEAQNGASKALLKGKPVAKAAAKTSAGQKR